MKNILFLICNLAAIIFVFAFVFAVANYLFGLRLGFRGAKVPGDPVAVVAFLVVAGIFGGVTYFLNKKNLSPQE